MLALLYDVVGWLLVVAGALGVTGSFVYHRDMYVPAGIICIAAGLVSFGLAHVCDALSKISANSQKTADLLKTIHESLIRTDELRAEEARSMRDLLVRVAVSAPSIVPAGAAKAPKPVMFNYSGEDMKSRGPFSVETMRALIADGTVRPETPVALESTEEWRTYAAFPELG